MRLKALAVLDLRHALVLAGEEQDYLLDHLHLVALLVEGEAAANHVSERVAQRFQLLQRALLVLLRQQPHVVAHRAREQVLPGPCLEHLHLPAQLELERDQTGAHIGHAEELVIELLLGAHLREVA